MLSECRSVSCVCKKVRRRARKTAENRKQFERKQGQFFHFFDGKALKNTENERNMNKCKIFLQKNIDIAIILWYDNYVHISNIRANVFFLKKLLLENAVFIRISADVREKVFVRILINCKTILIMEEKL